MKWWVPVLTLCALSACGGGGSGSSPTPAPTPTPTQSQTPPAAPTPTPPPSNFVVFIIDDLGISNANFMMAGERNYTPAIDNLAANSTVLTNYQTVTPICTPSRYALLTGKYPSRATNPFFANRITREGAAVPEFNVKITASEPTLPKRLQSLGYRTGYAGKDHVADVPFPTFPANTRSTDPGVSAQLQALQQAYTSAYNAMGFDEAYAIFPTNVAEWPVVDLQAHNLDWIVEGANKFIDGNRDKKFFLVVSLTIPHYPTDPARSWNANPLVTPFGYLPQTPNVMPARSTLTSRVRAAGATGKENLLWMDDAVNAVVSKLQQHNLLNSTSILVEGDHGTAAKGSIYRPGTWTPAFWYYRGIRSRNEQLTSNLDVQPSILQMAGGAPAGDGKSLVSLLEGQPDVPHANLYFELGYARSVIEGDYQYIAVRHTDYIRNLAATRGFPLTHWVQYGGPHAIELQTMNQFRYFFDPDQLYHLAQDPAQQYNLYGRPEYQTIVTHLQDVMQAEANKTPGTFKVRP